MYPDIFLLRYKLFSNYFDTITNDTDIMLWLNHKPKSYFNLYIQFTRVVNIKKIGL